VMNDGEQVTPPRPRMTMTLPVLSRALLIALLVTGKDKRAALLRLATNLGGNQSLPVARVIPDERSRLLWFLDADALPR
jgi:6-phosphogluconolactonase/glucosamine-6-phosphate isomerase/deaminase